METTNTYTPWFITAHRILVGVAHAIVALGLAVDLTAAAFAVTGNYDTFQRVEESFIPEWFKEMVEVAEEIIDADEEIEDALRAIQYLLGRIMAATTIRDAAASCHPARRCVAAVQPFGFMMILRVVDPRSRPPPNPT